MSVPCANKPGFRLLIALSIGAGSTFILLLQLLTDRDFFVWFLTESEQAEGKEGLGETERFPGGEESDSDVNWGETPGKAEEQIQNP